MQGPCSTAGDRGAGCGAANYAGVTKGCRGVKEVQGMQVAFMVQGSIREFFLSGHN